MADHEPVYYHDYLKLDRLLSAQEPLSRAAGSEAHDEMLFIIVHQAYELWFKQILHEIDATVRILSMDFVPEREMGGLVAHVERIHKIQRVLMDHLDVLETMTPLDFLDFRDRLIPASGFQSVQFRLIENRLGIRPEQRVLINEAPYTSRFEGEHRSVIEASEQGPSLHDLVEVWLERTPFLEMGDYAFWDEYRKAVDRMLDKERASVEANPNLTDEGRRGQLAAFERLDDTFSTIFDDDLYAALQEAGKRRLSRRAFMAALLINLYRDEPVVQLPFRLLTDLIDIDEGFAAWRQRHAFMVLRMIGDRIGTGGTSGHEYLSATTARSRIFGDLVEIPTFLIPRSELPPLPPALTEAMRFHYRDNGSS